MKHFSYINLRIFIISFYYVLFSTGINIATKQPLTILTQAKALMLPVQESTFSMHFSDSVLIAPNSLRALSDLARTVSTETSTLLIFFSIHLLTESAIKSPFSVIDSTCLVHSLTSMSYCLASSTALSIWEVIYRAMKNFSLQLNNSQANATFELKNLIK